MEERTEMPFVRYHVPTSLPRSLDMTPRLESWDKSGSPSQIALSSYLDHVVVVLGDEPREEPLSLHLNVGFDEGVSLTSGGRDLDNFLFPVVRRLGWQRFFAASASKVYGRSSICIDRCISDETNEATGWSFASIHTATSAAYVAWKHAIAAQLSKQVSEPARSGPVDVQLCFVVSATRNWTNLWKPAIDSLGAILGEDPHGRPFHPNDDRIVNLRLHRVIDGTIGNDVRIGIWWRPSGFSQTS
jgi:hypothetical protein